MIVLRARCGGPDLVGHRLGGRFRVGLILTDFDGFLPCGPVSVLVGRLPRSTSHRSLAHCPRRCCWYLCRTVDELQRYCPLAWRDTAANTEFAPPRRRSERRHLPGGGCYCRASKAWEAHPRAQRPSLGYMLGIYAGGRHRRTLLRLNLRSSLISSVSADTAD